LIEEQFLRQRPVLSVLQRVPLSLRMKTNLPFSMSTLTSSSRGEELAWLVRTADDRLRVAVRRRFDDWF